MKTNDFRSWLVPKRGEPWYELKIGSTGVYTLYIAKYYGVGGGIKTEGFWEKIKKKGKGQNGLKTA